MSEMLERVAKALGEEISNALVEHPDRVLYPDDFRRAASKALEAMREPTEEILRAGFEAQWPRPGTPAFGMSNWATWDEAKELDGFHEGKASVYRAMMDAALYGKP